MVNRHYDITVTKASDGKACAVTWKRNATFDTRMPERAIMSRAPRIRFVLTCSIPDDHIDPRRSAFFMARFGPRTTA